VTQIDVLEEYQLLLVLSNKTLLSYTLDILDPGDSQSQLAKRPKKIQNHANFFKAGVCMGRHLVCSAKMSGISTTIKVFEPMETASRTRRRMFQSGQEALKPFKVSLPSVLLMLLPNIPVGILRACGIVIH
jgi:RHO1 GDP-GTP exchange protein 1/2